MPASNILEGVFNDIVLSTTTIFTCLDAILQAESIVRRKMFFMNRNEKGDCTLHFIPTLLCWICGKPLRVQKKCGVVMHAKDWAVCNFFVVVASKQRKSSEYYFVYILYWYLGTRLLIKDSLWNYTADNKSF